MKHRKQPKIIRHPDKLTTSPSHPFSKKIALKNEEKKSNKEK
jgi:hypothetical protein